MKIEQFDLATEKVGKLRALQAELRIVDDLLTNVEGNCAVKVNTRWLFQLPAVTLKGHAQARKVLLEKEIKGLEDQLNVI